MDELQPLLRMIGIALSSWDVTDFDAARGLEADRIFADALLYEFLNADLFDEAVQARVQYDEEAYLWVITAEDMHYLLRQYIGDYPALIEPPTDIFLSRNESGGYVYFYSDMGEVDYTLETGNVVYVGSGIFEVSATLYEYDTSLEPGIAEYGTPVNSYLLRFQKADDSAYGYTIIGCVEAASLDLPTIILAYVKIDTDAWQSGDEADRLPLLMDEVLMVSGDDIENLQMYEIDPDSVSNDYALINEDEIWESYAATRDTVFTVVNYGNLELGPVDIGLSEFRDYMLKMQQQGLLVLARVTVAGAGVVIRIEEQYVP